MSRDYSVVVPPLEGQTQLWFGEFVYRPRGNMAASVYRVDTLFGVYLVRVMLAGCIIAYNIISDCIYRPNTIVCKLI